VVGVDGWQTFDRLRVSGEKQKWVVQRGKAPLPGAWGCPPFPPVRTPFLAGRG
jgi:hypothetical protein